MNECSEEKIEIDFNEILLQIITSNEQNLLTQEDYEYYDVLLQDQIEYFIGTGQYEQVMKIYRSIKSNAFDNKLPKISFHMQSPEVTYQLVDSFRDVGRQKREERDSDVGAALQPRLCNLNDLNDFPRALRFCFIP